MDRRRALLRGDIEAALRPPQEQTDTRMPYDFWFSEFLQWKQWTYTVLCEQPDDYVHKEMFYYAQRCLHDYFPSARLF